MSHRLFFDSIFSNARVWAFLKQVDEAEAARCRSAGCAYCGAALHSATYPRKPHGLAAELRADAPAVQPVLLPLPASGDAAFGALLRAAFPRGAAVRDGERIGAGRRTCGGARAQVGGPVGHAEALAAVVAREVRADPGVACEAGRAGGGARGGAAAVCAAPHPGSRPARTAVAQPRVASPLGGLLHARCRPDAARRECF